jgi:hypothetical protein
MWKFGPSELRGAAESGAANPWASEGKTQMARNQAKPTEKPEDLFKKLQREIHDDVSDLASEYQGRIAKRDAVERLAIATRAARRIRKAPLPPTHNTGLAQQSLNYAIWVADALPKGGEHREALAAALLEIQALGTTVRDAPAGPYTLEGELHRADSFFAIQQFFAVAFGLAGCIREALTKGSWQDSSIAASTLAHCIEAAELAWGRDERDRLEKAIGSDLKALPRQGTGPSPLWPSKPPAWYDEKAEFNDLSKVGAYVKTLLMAKYAWRQQPQDDILTGETLPPVEGEPSKQKSPSENMAIAERQFANVQRLQFDGIQKLLDALRGVVFETHEEAREIATRVTRLVHDSGGVLLMTGKFVDGRKRTKVFINEPVEIRCDDKTNSSFQMKTPETFKYITALPAWPTLFIVAKTSPLKPQQLDTEYGEPQ